MLTLFECVIWEQFCCEKTVTLAYEISDTFNGPLKSPNVLGGPYSPDLQQEEIAKLEDSQFLSELRIIILETSEICLST